MRSTFGYFRAVTCEQRSRKTWRGRQALSYTTFRCRSAKRKRG